MLRPRARIGRSVFVKLVIKKSGEGWQWVVEQSESERGKIGRPEITDGAENPARRASGRLVDGETAKVIPWLMAAIDPNEKWWERLRGNPKRLGEISQAAFLLKAEMLGLHLALPWGDSERYDFVVWARDGGPVYRVQVKGTGRLHRRGYEVQPVHSTRGQGKKRYTKKDIDVIAAHVQPVDAWYLIPIERVGRAKSLRLYPGIERRTSSWKGGKHARRRPRDWEKWRNAWEVLEGHSG
jgi:hypothetical protein